VIALLQGRLAMRAADRPCNHRLIGVFHKRSSAALTPQAALAGAFTLGFVRAVGFLACEGGTEELPGVYRAPLLRDNQGEKHRQSG
jgi:hypothetical protein